MAENGSETSLLGRESAQSWMHRWDGGLGVISLWLATEAMIVCETARASMAKDPLDRCVGNVNLNKRVPKIGSNGVGCFDHGERIA